MWAIICSHFCENWGFYTLLTQLPSYMNGNNIIILDTTNLEVKKYIYTFYFFKDVLKFDIGKGSLLSALPYLVMSVILQFSGFLVDWIRKNEILTTTQVRIFIFCNTKYNNYNNTAYYIYNYKISI